MRLPGILLALRSLTTNPPTQNRGNISVGFDLKDSYGTAAICYPNGTHLSIAQVEASDDYKKVMRKLSLESSTHLAPPYQSPGDSWSDWPRQLERRYRKSLGWPASIDDGALSSMIKSLKQATEKALGFEIVAASASIPRFPAIYDEDLHDSFEYAGLEYIPLLNQSHYYGHCLLYDTMSAVAGHNLSLCNDAEHPRDCGSEGELADIIYTVDYTRSSLFAYHTIVTPGGPYYVYDDQQWNLDIGSDRKDSYSNPDEYWEQVREIMLMPLFGHSREREAKKILFVGESVDDREFRRRATGILSEWYQNGMPPIYDEDPVFVQAKGVAELLRRSVYIPRPEKSECLAGQRYTELSVEVEL